MALVAVTAGILIGWLRDPTFGRGFVVAFGYAFVPLSLFFTYQILAAMRPALVERMSAVMAMRDLRAVWRVVIRTIAYTVGQLLVAACVALSIVWRRAEVAHSWFDQDSLRVIGICAQFFTVTNCAIAIGQEFQQRRAGHT